MPALWESSERPLYVKTVWINGFRHAILTKDDPVLLNSRFSSKKKRPTSSVSYAGDGQRDPSLLTVKQFKNSRLSHNEDQLGECFRKLQLVLTVAEDKSEASTARSLSPVSSIETNADADSPNAILIDCENGETEKDISDSKQLVLHANPQPIYEFEAMKTRCRFPFGEMKNPKRSNLKIINEESNDLSDRVLQWLDLAGRIDILFPNADTGRMTQPRLSCPEIRKKTGNDNVPPKAKLLPDIRRARNEGNVDGTLAKEKKLLSVPLLANDRPNIDCGLRAPLSSNVIETYAKLSRSSEQDRDTAAVARHVPGIGNQIRRVANQTLLQNSSRKAAPETNKTSTSKNGPNRNSLNVSAEVRQRVASEINSMEKQYVELVGKNIIRESNSRYGPKRQMHIFMPTLPKKHVGSTAKSEGTISSL